MMKSTRIFPMTVIALAVLAGCSTTPARNTLLDEARASYRIAEANPQARELAGGELKEAANALGEADAAWSRSDSPEQVNQLAYLARQRVAIAQSTAQRKAAEASAESAAAGRDEVRLAARTEEAETARRSADAARRDAAASQKQSQASIAQADESRGQAEVARLEAEASRRKSALAQQQAGAAQARSGQLEAQLAELNAKKTDRGMVVTIGDVLFDTNSAELKTGGIRSIEKLAAFLKQHPQRNAMIEGFTDSTGSDALNAALSARRADSVRAAMIGQGIGRERLQTQGFGEAHPVAGNDTADGRRSNRRVEVILSSDDGGKVIPR
jgi:outer membrane protein OmpA-like peptidoglycan-associated protein